MGISIDLSTA